ncbi:hypothetical protein H7F15_05455 [Pontibacter sp. Tf4]|uniref:AAA family ATPase n=1 Tax=Pontibacter sp. Tf4 TaxID=2761620 RepID=UPI001626CA97|nr:AAA family ATPase [Pontibacter sp. Tf4]MBB6610473.1 hypothetical protein [Pontibacter sp. Tf4]
MKIKKIEIDAFRAYKNKEQGTFDFSLVGGEVANLVSIYAPNGFGKSSFYDAIEWGITNRVQRLDWLEEEGLVEKQNASGQFVLKNREASDKLNATVTIHPLDGQPFTNQSVQVNGNTKSDYYFTGERSKLRNEFFQRVILSQEGINAFLRTEEPDCRYEQFSKHFGDERLEKYFKNIVSLLRENSNHIESLNGRAKELEKRFKSRTVEEEVIEKVNFLIAELRKHHQNLPDLSISSVASFIQEVKTLKKSLSFSKETALAELEGLNDLFNNFPAHLSQHYTLKKLSENVKNLDATLHAFVKLHELKVKLEREGLHLNKLQEQLQAINDVFPQYFILSDKKDEFKEQHQKLLKKQNEKKNEIPTISSTITTIEMQLEQHNEKLSNVASELEVLEAQFSKYQKLIESKEKIEKSEKASEEEIQLINYEISGIDEELLEVQHFEKALTSNHSNLKDYRRVVALVSPELSRLESNIQEQQAIKISLESCTQKKKQLSILEKNIVELLSFGRQVIQELKDKSCPLCGNDHFKDKNELLQAIERNNTLSNDKDSLAKDEAEYQSRLFKLKIEEDKINELIKNSLSGRKTTLQNARHRAIQSIDLIRDRQRVTAEEWKSQEPHFNNLFQYFQKGFVFKNESLRIAKKDLELKINQLTVMLEEEKGKRISTLGEIEKFALNVELLTSKIRELENEDVFQLILDHTSKNSELNGVTKVNIQSYKASIKERITLTENTLKELNTKFNEYEDELSKYKQFEVETSISELKSQILDCQVNIQTYEQTLRKHGISFVDKEKLGQHLESKLVQYKNKVQQLNEHIIAAENLEGYSTHIEHYLEASALTIELKNINEKIRQLTEVAKDLEECKRVVSEKLVSYIKDFFQEKLINDIYQRIDPHPDYKEISFHPDLSGNKGCLYIRIKEKNGNEEYAPILYLSSAQINVLSLSIFLARALHATDDKGAPIDCIFMDDPVQSMDSINVLSLIDLLRSIVYNYGKQVIISTHDDNFHHLLQKKIPSEFFPSKFLELESFGKVKVH